MKRFDKLLIIIILILFSGSVIQAEDKGSITQEDMIYFIFTDRFYDGDKNNNAGVNKGDLTAYHGGDFQGIIDKLDYIKDLGFTAIWISPVVENQVRGYHGYWATDYYNTNEHFGSMEKLKELVDKAHTKGIKVIFDIVFNHTGQMHPFVSDGLHEGWFHEKYVINNYNDQREVEEGWLASLPDFDQSKPEVREYLIKMAKWWIKETGVDGYRLDTVRHISKDFWEEFSREIKKDYPDFYLIGEVFHGNVNYVADYQKIGLDGLVDFPMYYKINDVFSGSKSVDELQSAIEMSSIYKNRYLMGTFIDNHDVPRFVNGVFDNAEERLKNALAFEFTYTGIPVMYYGTEVGLEGGADPDNRRDMDFESKSSVKEYVKKLADIRKTNSALTRGDISLLDTNAGILAYVRKHDNNVILTVFNTTDESKEISLNVTDEIGQKGKFINLLSDNDKKLTVKGGSLNIKLQSLETAIYKLQPESGSAGSTGLYLGIALVVIIAAGIVLFIKRKKNAY